VRRFLVILALSPALSFAAFNYYPVQTGAWFEAGMIADYYSGVVERCWAVNSTPPEWVDTYQVMAGTAGGTQQWDFVTLTNQLGPFTYTANGQTTVNYPFFDSECLQAIDYAMLDALMSYVPQWLADSNGVFHNALEFDRDRAQWFNHLGIGRVLTNIWYYTDWDGKNYQTNYIYQFSEGPLATQNIVLATLNYGLTWDINIPINPEYSGTYRMQFYPRWMKEGDRDKIFDIDGGYAPYYGKSANLYSITSGWDILFSMFTCTNWVDGIWTNFYYQNWGWGTYETGVISNSWARPAMGWNHLFDGVLRYTTPEINEAGLNYDQPPPVRPRIQMRNWTSDAPFSVTISGYGWTSDVYTVEGGLNKPSGQMFETLTVSGNGTEASNWWIKVTNFVTDATGSATNPIPTNATIMLIYDRPMVRYPNAPVLLTAEGYNERCKLLDAMRWTYGEDDWWRTINSSVIVLQQTDRQEDHFSFSLTPGGACWTGESVTNILSYWPHSRFSYEADYSFSRYYYEALDPDHPDVDDDWPYVERDASAYTRAYSKYRIKPGAWVGMGATNLPPPLIDSYRTYANATECFGSNYWASVGPYMQYQFYGPQTNGLVIWRRNVPGAITKQVQTHLQTSRTSAVAHFASFDDEYYIDPPAANPWEHDCELWYKYGYQHCCSNGSWFVYNYEWDFLWGATNNCWPSRTSTKQLNPRVFYGQSGHFDIGDTITHKQVLKWDNSFNYISTNAP